MVISDQKDEALKGVRFLSRVVKEGLTEQVTFEPTLGGGEGGKHLDITWKDFSGTGNSRCKVEMRRYGRCLWDPQMPSMCGGAGEWGGGLPSSTL